MRNNGLTATMKTQKMIMGECRRKIRKKRKIIIKKWQKR
jgi:hypothetical protein